MLISLITIFSLTVVLIIQLSLVITLPTGNNLTETITTNQKQHQQLSTVFDFESLNYKLLSSSSSQPNQSLIIINSKWKSKINSNNLNDSGFLSLINYDPISLIKLNHPSSFESPVTLSNDNQTTESIVAVDSISDDVNYTNDEDDQLFTDQVDDDEDEDNNQDDHLNVEDDDDDDYYLNDLITIDNGSWIKGNDSNDQLIKRSPINQQNQQTIKVITTIVDDQVINNDSIDHNQSKFLMVNPFNLTKLPIERSDSRSPKSLRDRANHQSAGNPSTGLNNRSHRGNGTLRFRDGCPTLRSSEYNRPRTVIIRMKNHPTNHN